MDSVLNHVASGECEECVIEMRRVYRDFQADEAQGGSFPITYGYLGLTLICMSFLFRMLGKGGMPVGSLPVMLGLMGIGCWALNRFLRKGA